MAIIDCEHRYTGMGRIFVYNLEEKRTVSHHAWDEQDYAVTDDFLIRADTGSKFDLNLYAFDASAILYTKIEKMKILIEDTKTSLKIEEPSIKSSHREIMLEMGGDVNFSANKTSIVALSHVSEGNGLAIWNFWLNKR
eukprot:TRINITY_DN14026_c0_g1_i1.p1 TRINITY_DN14026_c0_g1~~TRINITY_DN14026_c0_g1_i1.p1  ORF type:complete len:138 (-),score=22.34 TRINITY_DN14026_c0_g1_i1:72-485(-)